MKNKQFQQKGAALLIFLIFFTVASAGLILALTRSIYSDLYTYNLLAQSKQSYLAADSFNEDMAYRYIAGLIPDEFETNTLFGAEVTSTSTFLFDRFELETEANNNGIFRKAGMMLVLGAGASFNFGVQTGNGGFTMSNSAQVIGNVFSNGPINGQGSSMLRGDVISAGPSGYVEGIHATGSVYANTIWGTNPRPTLIEGDAYFQSINLSYVTVWGDPTPPALHPGSADEATTTLPIPDDVVAQHQASTTEAIAASAGTLIAATDPECDPGVTDTYVINADTTFTEPTKIECDVSVQQNSTTLTLQDTLWIEGNLSFSQGPTVEADPATSTDSIMIIVDDPSDRTTGSKVDIGNSTNFVAATSPKSYIVIVSMNDSAENGGSETAINMAQSSNGDVVIYAGHGKISMANGIYLKEVTAYEIEMGNNTTIEYESGLLNLNFTTGPGGGFEIEDWLEL